ncbi:type IV secretory pathway VirJ component [Novosphingobium hassiacum]|uniref:Type IV secretory pathway VirJ component n=1 Tax=Novosphingobium hassiacum TaxID=173676 RepID=A0A7W6EU11_9SPHN|nr:AcvB/VirJ family lysyl-phosphatidylglycerol hydrolase [Novosphingobium hassiacum]MBB3858798.1 type IV secretory pathway VirJ component [Novosphingobium hassiacum]
MTVLRSWKLRGAVVAAFALFAALNAPALHLLGWNERTEYPASAGKRDIAAVFLSGDMGLRLGMSKDIARGLAARGYPVTGISSPVAFSKHLDRAQTDAVVTDAIEDALARGARKVVLIGQSFGADILATVVPGLPLRLRSQVAGVVLVVPSNNVHFRADPSGIAYLGTPDARPARALARMEWTRLTCVHGADEAASLCGMLGHGTARDVPLPGDHYLHHDAPRVVNAIVSAISDMHK